MALQSATGRIALEWLFSETFPLHTQFVEQPQPLHKWELGKWHDCAAYSWWAKDVRLRLLAGVVPEQRMFVRLQLQRAGRLCELHRSVDMCDVLRLSAELELPIRPHSWFLGPIHWAGESQEYVDRVFNVAAIVAQGREPPAELASAGSPPPSTTARPSVCPSASGAAPGDRAAGGGAALAAVLPRLKIFGKGLVPHEVEARMQSCLKTSSRGNSFVKFNIWDTSGQPLPDPGDLAGRSCKLKVELRQCWLMPPSWGILMEVTDL